MHCVMDSAAVVPHDDVARLPAMPVDELVLRQLREQELEQSPALLARHAVEMLSEERIDEDRLATGDRMSPDHRMALRLGVRIFHARKLGEDRIDVNSTQSLEHFLHRP